MLEATDLYVEFAGRGGRRARAVDGVNLSIGAGEIVALVGESGCGKTTLARTLLGLERPTSGEIVYDGSPLSYSGRALKAFRRQVQLVLQDPMGSLNPRHTVYEAVAEGPESTTFPTRNRWSPRPFPAPVYALRSASSIAIPTNSPAVNANASSSPVRSPSTPRS